MKRRGCEGLVAKNECAPCVSGPTSLWRKVKVRREGRYVGGVPRGLMRAAIGELLGRAERRPEPPCIVAHRARRVAWYEPRVQVEITYAEIIQGELRDPVFRRLVPTQPPCAPAARDPSALDTRRTIAPQGEVMRMKRVTSALLLGLPLLALAVVAYADCGGSHTTASSEQIAQPAPPPPPPSPHG